MQTFDTLRVSMAPVSKAVGRFVANNAMSSVKLAFTEDPRPSPRSWWALSRFEKSSVYAALPAVMGCT